MKRKLFKLLVIPAFLLCGCGKGEKIPDDKTVIRLYGYAGGYGRKWIDNLISRYTEAVKDVSFEPGKTGVYFLPTCNKNSPVSKDDIIPTDYDIMFTESSSINEWFEDGCFECIDDVVTGENSFEPGKKIVDKMSDVQKEALKMKDGKYYALPTYSGVYGFIYNKDLFKSNNYYFKDGGGFVMSDSDKKSAGPDGEFNTFDDGLPVTTDDYIDLCYLISNSDAPFLFSGQYRSQYACAWMFNAAASIDGEEITRARYDFNDIKNVPVAKISGNAVVDGEFETIDVTAKTGYELYRSKGFTEAFRLLDEIITTNMTKDGGQFTSNLECYDNTCTHQDAQTYFISPQSGSKRAAMLMEGTWWYNEAKDFGSFDYIAGSKDINFGFMPFPHLEGQTENVAIDSMRTAAYIRKDVERSDGKLKACKDFLRFAYTDESMVDFSVTTNTFFGLDYSMGSRRNELSNYGKSLFDYKESKHTHILPAYANNDIFRKNEKKLLPHHSNLTFGTTNPVDYFKAGNHYDTALVSYYTDFAKNSWFVK